MERRRAAEERHSEGPLVRGNGSRIAGNRAIQTRAWQTAGDVGAARLGLWVRFGRSGGESPDLLSPGQTGPALSLIV